MSNLSYLFANTTYAPPKQIILAGGKLTVYKRPQSAQYQCRFKLANNKWHSASTGTAAPVMMAAIAPQLLASFQ